MNWRVVAAAVIGTSHVVNQGMCEDSCWAQVDFTANGMPLLSIFVSDGAGSAARGGEGAELAIQVAAEFMDKKIKSFEFCPDEKCAAECIDAVRNSIYVRAESIGLKARDFACTFLGVISSDQGTVVMQIGDGGIVIDLGNGLNVPIAPMSGEYANMTYFVTDEHVRKFLVVKKFSEKARRVAVFSDGLQRLSMNMSTNTVHEPFFKPFFNALSIATADQEDSLHGQLVRFLASPAVNQRTDDDKTLALAVLVP